ncbi:MAG: hypothetical protein LUC23_03895 [Prevotellaceae bacterium]|nr:hypothetical protein [Prevotellaceae bacterium]
MKEIDCGIGSGDERKLFERCEVNSSEDERKTVRERKENGSGDKGKTVRKV